MTTTRCPEMTLLPWYVIVQCEETKSHGGNHWAALRAPDGQIVQVNWHQREGME